MFATSQIAGNLTRDPEIKIVGDDVKLTEFSIAVNDTSGNKERTYFFNVKAWGNRAQVICDSFKKGDPIAVTCSLQQDVWEDKKTQQPRRRDVHNVIAIQFNSRKFQDARDADMEDDEPDPSPNQTPPRSVEIDSEPMKTSDTVEEEIPF